MMPTVALFICLFLFSCLSCRALMASPPQRRKLHQPLISPQSSPAPKETHSSPPFFPTDPPPPPPPLPPPGGVPDSSSSPVNITSLQRPSSSSSSSSHTHLLLIAAAASAVILVAASVFYYFRRRKHNSISTHNQEEKPFSPPSALYYMNPDPLASIKVDSPELRPLPHLPPLGFPHTHHKDEDEVFYSPKSTGSASKRTSSSAAAVEKSNGGGEYDSSFSSSSSSSPPHSSITISPPSRRSSNSPLEKKEPPSSSSPPPPSEKEEEEKEDVGILKTAIAAPPPAPPINLFQPSAAPSHGVAAMGVKVEACNKPKLKALHWDKVKATSNREMVWDQLKSSSFKVNEEMMESLFVANSSGSKSEDFIRRSGTPCGNQEMRVLDPKKAQNVSILIRALNVTVEEVREALLEGNEVGLGRELLECLLKMAPTKEEERKLKECGRDVLARLCPAERFLKAIIDIPFAFRRVDALFYVVNFEHEVEYLMMAFKSLQVACEDLRNNRTFLRLLEAVLKTGNRMNVGTNRGEARAFKLDTLLKLVDVKGIDGKTTLLHFVVKEMIKSEGEEKTGLKLVSSLTYELESVKKAAAMDSEVLSGEVRKLCLGIEKIEEVVGIVGEDEGGGRFREWMRGFVKMAEGEIIKVEEEERVAICKVKEITEYFHGNMSREEAHPFRIFMVVRDFLFVLDRVCKEMGMVHNSRFR